MVYPDSFLKELNITPEGVLVNTMEEVNQKLKRNQDAGMSDDATHGVVNNNLVWRTGTLENNQFVGLLLVFGKGNVFVYCVPKKTAVDIQEVVTKGKNVGFFEDDAVDIVIEGLSDQEYTVYAVFSYNDQYFGPYPKNVQKK